MSQSPARSSSLSTPSPNMGLGALLIVLAFLCAAILSALGKLATHASTGTIVFFQNSVSLLLFLPWLMWGGWAELKTSHILLHVVRAMTGLLSQVLMFAALKKMPLMNAVLLSNSAPLFIPLVAWVWLKEKIGLMTWLSLLIGFGGIVLILKPGRSLLENPAAILATAAAICSAIALVSVNVLSRTDSARRILFYYFLISTLAAAPFLSLGWQTPTARDWACLVGIGAFMAACQLLIILAYRHAKPERIAPFNYSVVIFSGLIGWIIWKDTPGPLALAGVALVSAGGILSTVFGGPNSRGHFLWIGHWNLPFLKRIAQEIA
jgi:drug/metabolite transporter (DMT)-like permease